MFYGQQKYARRLRDEAIDENTVNDMVHQRLSDGAKRHLPVIRQGNLKSPNQLGNEDYLSSIPSHDVTNRSNDIFLASKKDVARKNLMGYLYSRQPTISRSNSFIAGERPAEPGFPSVKFKNTPKKFERQKSMLFEQRRPPSFNKEETMKKPVDRRRSAGSNRPSTNRFSLPEIMRDIYSSAAKLDNEEDYECEYEDDLPSNDGNSVDINENIIPINLVQIQKPRMFPSNHRPITPGLIDKLNKRRVPAKLRTEQWLTQVPDDPKGYQQNKKRGRHYDTPNKWIYSDNT